MWEFVHHNMHIMCSCDIVHRTVTYARNWLVGHQTIYSGGFCRFRYRCVVIELVIDEDDQCSCSQITVLSPNVMRADNSILKSYFSRWDISLLQAEVYLITSNNSLTFPKLRNAARENIISRVSRINFTRFFLFAFKNGYNFNKFYWKNVRFLELAGREWF